MSLHVAMSGWLLGPPSGANRRLLALLANAAPLLDDDERVTVLQPPAFAAPFSHPRITWHPVAIPARPTLLRALAERRLLPRLLRELGVDVIDHGFLPAPRVPCALLQTLHDLRDVDGHGSRPRWLASAAVRRAAGRAALVLVPSEFTRARVLATAPAARVAIVGNGVDPQPVSAAPRDGPLLHVGHLEPRKNLTVLLRALASLPPPQRPQLWLTGADAGAGHSLRALAERLGIAASVRFLGVVADAELPALYASARAVVVPSHCEGFGLCALEGLAHGRPVLVAATGALPEVVGDCGVVLPADDVAAWATAIAVTATDRGDPAARRARAANFSWPRAAANLVAAWRAVGRGKGSHPEQAG